MGTSKAAGCDSTKRWKTIGQLHMYKTPIFAHKPPTLPILFSCVFSSLNLNLHGLVLFCTHADLCTVALPCFLTHRLSSRLWRHLRLFLTCMSHYFVHSVHTQVLVVRLSSVLWSWSYINVFHNMTRLFNNHSYISSSKFKANWPLLLT